ncbi:MAG: hypothetical protein WC989_07575 [Micavibrio sp.]
MAWQEFEQDGGLLWDVFLSADEDGAKGVKDFLKLAGLPNPQEGQYFTGPNVNRIYSSKHGVSVSILHRNISPVEWLKSKLLGAEPSQVAPVYAARKIAHGNIVKPLFQADISKNCSVEIVGGLRRAQVTEKDLGAMRKTLAQDKVDFYYRNLEFLGEVSTRDGEKHKVVTNRRAVRPMKSYNMAAQGSFGVQDEIYRPLCEQFAEAFKEASGAKMAQAMKECALITALPDKDPAKILHAHWTHPGLQTERRICIATAAKKYEQVLAAM